jgi:hypothetical protein
MVRVERVYPGVSLRRLTGDRGLGEAREVVYYTAGADADPGAYSCTFCGTVLRLRRAGALPLCAECDGTEFVARAGQSYLADAEREVVRELAVAAA